MRWSFVHMGVVAVFLCAEASQAGDALKGPVRAQVLRVIDGDTLEVNAIIWVDQTIRTRVRLSRVDTPELHGRCAEEKRLAEAARDYLRKRVENREVVLKNVQWGKYAGRVLADVESLDGESLARSLVEQGFARPYDGKKRKPWCL